MYQWSIMLLCIFKWVNISCMGSCVKTDMLLQTLEVKVGHSGKTEVQKESVHILAKQFVRFEFSFIQLGYKQFCSGVCMRLDSQILTKFLTMPFQDIMVALKVTMNL